MNSSNKMPWKIYVFSLFAASTLAQFYEDQRCRCVCPTATSILNGTEKSDRTLYIAYVPPNKCNCYGVILPKVAEQIRHMAQIFCLRCDCKYQTRNTTVIMVVVILVLWTLMLLIGYYLFLTLLQYLITKKKQTYSTVDPNSDETENLLIQGEYSDD